MQGSKAARLTDGDAGFAGIDNTAPPAACTALVASAKIRGGGGLQGAGCKLQQRQHAPRLRVAMSVRRRRTGPGVRLLAPSLKAARLVISSGRLDLMAGK
ncbi:hypothetical protein PF005_g23526 [Phytophthora fragariae]|uniref:Uncharacterized protein n=1 Tax=Phytophthora fragariae TaxID=53985 RepID=A0A6A4CAL1_9STRA|nr:hypothetical protein PF003_g9942 [Phytophthora fragariae]KAE8945338.1 hypothetical protein PF009_g4995 [Phytophthora fragariae]KAE8991678.1 hypothetical protein PF011_g17851 [Phytophthora fragariae]KAE9079499.1 hypothetical protein PF010_g22736 [Phytophthora fragariae]KAE9083475.1 hypothetical protein PF007_g21882 [Phytophthora fragariae]